MFALYFFKTKIGLYVLPVAMNAAHFIVFALAMFVKRKDSPVEVTAS